MQLLLKDPEVTPFAFLIEGEGEEIDSVVCLRGEESGGARQL